MTYLPWVKGTQDIGYGLYSATSLGKNERIINADTYAYFSDAVYLNEDGLNKTRSDDMRQREVKTSYWSSDQLGNITGSEFQSLPPEVRLERFGFEI